MVEVGMPMWALIDVFSTIEAGFAKSGSSAWTRKNGPLKLIASERSTAASSHCSSGRRSATPALTTRMSSPPKAWPTVLTSAACAATWPASEATTSAPEPSVLPAASSVVGLLPVIATRAPSVRNSCAVARPIPVVPPVMSARLPLRRFMSDPRGLGGAGAAGVAGVRGAGRLYQHDAALARGLGLVLDAARHDVHLARLQRDVAVAEVKHHLAVEDDENLVGVRVLVPDEVALDPGQLEVVVVHLGDDLGRPLLGELRELVGEVDWRAFHASILPRRGRA